MYFMKLRYAKIIRSSICSFPEETVEAYIKCLPPSLAPSFNSKFFLNGNMTTVLRALVLLVQHWNVILAGQCSGFLKLLVFHGDLPI